jgi:hypothetical protein
MAKALGTSVVVALMIAASCVTLTASQPSKLAAQQAQTGLHCRDQVHSLHVLARAICDITGAIHTALLNFCVYPCRASNADTERIFCVRCFAGGSRQLLGAQKMGNVVTPKQPKAVARKSWGVQMPSGSADEGRRLLAAQAFKDTTAPNKPSVAARKSWGPNWQTLESGRKLLAAQAFKDTTAPNKPSVAARKSWGPNWQNVEAGKKLLAVAAFIEPTAPKKPKEIAAARFVAKTTRP